MLEVEFENHFHEGKGEPFLTDILSEIVAEGVLLVRGIRLDAIEKGFNGGVLLLIV